MKKHSDISELAQYLGCVNEVLERAEALLWGHVRAYHELARANPRLLVDCLQVRGRRGWGWGGGWRAGRGLPGGVLGGCRCCEGRGGSGRGGAAAPGAAPACGWPRPAAAPQATHPAPQATRPAPPCRALPPPPYRPVRHVPRRW